MRVISGSARGLKLKAPEGLSTRPTTDRNKESLFNILAPDLYECRFLDLFSGSGAIGIEALSRGAKCAVMVDSDAKSIKVIKANVEAARVSERAEIITADVCTAIRRLGSIGRKFDIVFMDPPYSKGLVEKALEAIVEMGLLDEDGYIVAEQASEEPPLEINGLSVYRIKDYRATKMSFLSCK